MDRYTIGIDLGGTKIMTALSMNSNPKKILTSLKCATESSKGREHVIENINKTIEKVIKKANLSEKNISNIGIGVPGPVDYKNGIVRICPNLKGWKNVPVKEIFEKKWEIPVFVENDARAAGLAEASFGAGKDFSHVFFVTVSTGIGGAIIIDKKIYHGADGAAGEIGQTRLIDRSIFEKNCSGPAIEKIFGISPEQISSLLKEGNPQAQKALNHLSQYLGIWLANAATLLNPEIIIIGGGLSKLGSIFINPLKKVIQENAFSISRNVLIKKAVLADFTGVLGAIALTKKEL